MFAVIKSGGKQHRVQKGETLRLEKLEIATGGKVDFGEALMVGEGKDVKIGAPSVKGRRLLVRLLLMAGVIKLQL